VAFTFSGAAARFDTRRQLIVEETNAIGTAYLRLDLLPADVQPTLRGRFRQYLAARLEAYRKLPDIAAAQETLARSVQLQGESRTRAVAESRRQEAHPDAAKLLLPALNAMIDIMTTRTLAAHMHPPMIIIAMLFGLALTCALLAGHGRWHGAQLAPIVSFTAISVVVVYVIMEFPRLGLLQVKAFDQALEALPQSMKCAH
jgi:CHASE2 domain-containing sensor protein